MRQPKSYSILEVLNFTDVGLVYEFYSTKEPAFIIDNTSRLMGKNVILTNENNISPTFSSAVLFKEYEAARARYRLLIASQNYHSVVPIIDGISQWINENCETTFDTQLKISLSFNHQHLQTLTSLSQMNPTRLILKLDENEIYKRFPEQKNSPYALSIKNLVPITTFVNESDFENNVRYVINTPFAEFYGINFKNYTQGVLEFNYIGGPEYAEKITETQQLLEYFILKTYQAINDNEVNDFERFEVKRLVEGFGKMQTAFFDPTFFLNEYKNLKVYVDLKTSDQIIKTYWDILRKPLFEMIVNGNLTKGQFNYDTQLGRFQLRNASLNGVSIKSMDLVKCDISGVLENCSFVSCKLNKTRVYNSHFISGNKISESHMESVSLNKGNQINKCFIHNNEEIIRCKVTESVILYATPAKGINVDDKTSVIIKPEILPPMSNALQVNEIRDYSWIKNMRQTTEKLDFGNAYNKKSYIKKNK